MDKDQEKAKPLTPADMGFGAWVGIRAFWPLGIIIGVIWGGLALIFLSWPWALGIGAIGFYVGTRLPFFALARGG